LSPFVVFLIGVKIYRRPALMDVAKLHSQGQSIREIARQLETSKYWVEYSISEIQRNPDKLIEKRGHGSKAF